MYAGLSFTQLSVCLWNHQWRWVLDIEILAPQTQAPSPHRLKSRAFLASFLPGGEHSFPRLARAVLMLQCFHVPVIKYFRNCQVPGSAWAERHTRSGTFCAEPLGQAGRWDGKRAQFKEPKAVSALRGHNAKAREAARDGRAVRCRDGCRAIPAEGPFFFWLQVTTEKHSQNQGRFRFFNW